MAEEASRVFRNVMAVSAKAYVRNRSTALVRLDGCRERFELPEDFVEIHEQRVLHFRYRASGNEELEFEVRIALYPEYVIGKE